MMKFYRQHSAEQTYPETQRANVTTQLALMMEPLHQCDPKYCTET
jgi:hypothetical protein